MIVQFKRERFEELQQRWPDDRFESIAIAGRDLVDEKYYVVLAVMFDLVGYDGYVIGRQGSCPLSFCSLLFDVVDPRLSQWWVFYTKRQQDDRSWERQRPVRSWLAFPEWTPEPGYLESLVDGEKRAVETFRNYQDLMDLEFRRPDIESRAEQLQDGWVMCPECTEAWELDVRLELCICPECERTLLNPYRC